MGITADSLNRINKYLKHGDSILILGCQNLYNSENYGEIAHSYYEQHQYNVFSLDILGCQGSKPMDLRDLLYLCRVDLVLQHGTIEHIDGSLYTPLMNIHNSCKAGGVMIHENPLTDNWPGHGQHYFTPDFWDNLAKTCEYELIENTTEPAMGNTVDGWNSCAVLRKLNDREFISEEQFNQLYKSYIKSK